ncbi:MAG: ATP-dependent DNA helicase RecG [Bacilli bacterium]|nr:ATP-dependent DNA helicase RecG [Bacilli bacterium]
MKLNDIMIANEDYILARYQNLLKKQNILSIEDLLFNFPTKYEDYRVSSIKDAKLDEPIVLEGTIVSKVTVNYLKSKLSTVVFTMEIECERIRCTIFNRVFLKGKINYGTVLRIQGHFYQNMNNFTVNNLLICDEINRDIVPVYKVKDIAHDKYLGIMEKAYRRYKNLIVETLPKELLEKHGLLSMQEAIYKLHFADDFDQINKALERIKYEELLQYQLSMKYLHYMREQDHNCPVINYDLKLLEKLNANLSYELTQDQKLAINDILTDLKAPYAMNRLLQGEVGSGKTIVAEMAILATVSGGYQAALMCPTEILSNQHYETLIETFKDFDGVKLGILTGSTSVKDRNEIIEKLKNGDINVIVGTHALFQSDVEYQNLALVVTDEEHRFGVHQRVMIKNKGFAVNYLKMSATPIPRTLAISAYGDTDISVIKTLPSNRKQVITKLVDKPGKKAVMAHMKEELKNGHQIYVVTPLIDESEAIDTANANEVYNKMVKYFKDEYQVGLIHGKLKPTEKEEIMEKFLKNEIHILVATSVIEVGVNVANATTILILGAERFGVATLHQLRGRVMRSGAVPYCFLIPENITDVSLARLKMVEETSDGFKLAEYDLLHRGPGEFFGERQAGAMNFKYADILKDNDLLEVVIEDSKEIMNTTKLMDQDDYHYLFEVVHNNYLVKTSELD